MHIAHGYVPVVPCQQLAHTEETQEAWQLLALFSDESGMHAVSKRNYEGGVDQQTTPELLNKAF